MSQCSKCGTKSFVREYSTGTSAYRSLCTDCAKKDSTTKVVSVNQVPLYTQASLVDDLDVIVTSTNEGKSWRFPLNRLLAGGDIDKLRYSLNRKTSDIEVPPTQVVPVYVPGVDLPVEKAQAIPGKTAQFLAIANDTNNDNHLVIQNSGFVTFPRLHMYQVGKTYYLSQTAAGEVVSEKPKTGIVQPLFTVVDELTISINMGV